MELCWGTVEQADAIGLIDAARHGGFSSVAIAPRQVPADDRGLAALAGHLADTGVQARVLDAILSYLPGSADPAAADPRFREVLSVSAGRCFEIADALGCEVVNAAHFLGTPVPLADMAAGVAELARIARRHGRRLTLEFIPSTGLPDLATTVAVIEASGADVTIMLDTWHFARSGGTVAQLAELAPGAIGGIQLSDRIEPPPGTPYRAMEDRLLPGAGKLPLRAMLAVVRPRNPGVPVGIEVFSAELRSRPACEAARAAAAALAGILTAG